MKILIPFDGSGFSRNALSDLQSSGLPEKAEARIFSVSETYLSPNLNQISPILSLDNDVTEYIQQYQGQMKRNLEETKQILHEAEEDLRKYFPRWQITVETASGTAAGEILAKASTFAADLIVIGEQGLSWDNTQRLGSVSNKVLTEAECSLRIAKSKNELGAEPLKIAVCFDGSPGSLNAVKTIAARRWKQKIEVRLLTVSDLFIATVPGRVLQIIPGVPEGTMPGEKKWIDSLAQKAFEILRGKAFSADLRISSGNPRIVLPAETTRWGAHLVFIGASFDPSKHSSLGSVARAVAERARCTVEVVRMN